MYSTLRTEARPPRMERVPWNASAVTVEGSQSGQGADLLAVEVPEFRQIGEERDGGGRSRRPGYCRGPRFVRASRRRIRGRRAIVVSIFSIVLRRLIDHVLNALADVPRGSRFRGDWFRQCAIRRVDGGV